MSHGTPSAVAANRGMTLIEVATALIILTIAVGVAVPAFRSLGEEDDLSRATRRVETLFRLARDSAIKGGRPVTVVIDSVTGLVWVDAPNRHRLAEETMLQEAESLFDLGGIQPGPTTLMSAPPERLEPGEPIGLPAAIRMELPRARALFRFEPSGAALADTLLLTGPLGTRIVTIDPWTGDARVRQ